MPNSPGATKSTPSMLRISMELTQPMPREFRLTFQDSASQHTMVENVSATHLTTACGKINWLRLSGWSASVLERFLKSLAISTGGSWNGDRT